MSTTSHHPDTLYIVGGGIAGVMVAYRTAMHCKERGEPVPPVVIIDQNPSIADGSSHAYGGFITANSYLTVDFSSAKKAQMQLGRHYVPDAQATDSAPRGWLTHQPSAAEKRWINAVLDYSDRPDIEKTADKLRYHHFGYGCAAMWQELFDHHPDLKKASGFAYHSGEQTGVLKIYDQGCGKDNVAINTDIDFLRHSGSDGVHTRTVDADEAAQYCPQIAALGEGTKYSMQHGGNVNGQALCHALLKQMKQEGCDVSFLPETEVRGVDYSNNANRIAGLRVHSEGKERILGSFTDRFVFASGPASKLWSELGFGSSPIMGVAGTSLTVPISDDFHGPRPTRPLKLVDEHGGPVMIPMVDAKGDSFVRMGGYTAFAGEQAPQKDATYARDFLNRQYAWLKRMYPELAAHFLLHELAGNLDNLPAYSGSWAGCRPVTCDNHAVVGPVQRAFRAGEAPSSVDNGWLAAGLGAAGFLGIGVADIVAQQLVNPDTPVKVPGITNTAESKQFMGMVDSTRLEPFRSPLPAQNPSTTAL